MSALPTTPFAWLLRRVPRSPRPDAPPSLPAPGPAPKTARVEDALRIPVREDCPIFADRQQIEKEGRFLARQDRWEDLSTRIREAEILRATTADGMPVADLLTYGARLDLLAVMEDGLRNGSVPAGPHLEHGLAALETVLEEFPGDHAIALVVALTHIDMAWAWRAASPSQAMPQVHRRAFRSHFVRAAEIVDGFCPFALDSPTLAAARCALLADAERPGHRVADDYEDLIDLDPHNYRHMRAMGNHLLPRWFGSYPALELEARRNAARTRDLWGAAGYTWVYFDALAQDDATLAHVDEDFFIDGLRDILARVPDQSMVNMLAAYCATTLGENTEGAAPHVRARIAACADWIVRDHMTELHPMVWAHAAAGFDNNLRVGSMTRFAARGRDSAFRALGRLFRDEIAGGARIDFTSDGLRVHG